MKRAVFLLSAVLITCFSGVLFADSISLLTPNGGEELIAGQRETITWEYSGDINFINIEFSDNNGFDWDIIDRSTENDGEYEWAIPEVTSNNCLVRISDVNNPRTYDTSDDVLTVFVCQLLAPTDFNYDCKIGFADLATFAFDWLRNGNPFNKGYTEAPEGLAFIPGREFMMGDHFGEGNDEELPVHAVNVDSFFMGKFETTNGQYCDFLNAANVKVVSGVVYASTDSTNIFPYCDTHNGSEYSQIDYSGGVFSVRVKSGRYMLNDPMVQVSWYGAVAYCNWRSVLEGYQACYNLSTWECDFTKNGYRLPTEAEWERAARRGKTTPYRRFPWGDTISHNQASYFAHPVSYLYDVNPTNGVHPAFYDGVLPYTAPVGYFPPTGFGGLYDMTGNVREWCNDWYQPNYYSASPYNNPTGPFAGVSRVVRGGYYSDYAFRCRVAYRRDNTESIRNQGCGFRVARNLN